MTRHEPKKHTESAHIPTPTIEDPSDIEPVGETDAEELDPAQAQLLALEADRDQYKDLYMRTLAEFQNFRRRTQEEKEQLRRFATESLVRDLLPVLDNFERTLAALDAGASTESLVEGVRMVDKQMRAILEGVKLRRILPLGEHFDPEHHEAIATEDSDEHEPGTVIQVLESGYKMNDRVIRAARVKVAKQK